MSAQAALALPSPAPSKTVIIHARCSLRIEADERVIVVAGLPVHHYRGGDAAAEAYATVFLVESGFAQQTDVARAFGRSERSVRRYQARYAQGGMAALGHQQGWRRGRDVSAANVCAASSWSRARGWATGRLQTG